MFGFSALKDPSRRVTGADVFQQNEVRPEEPDVLTGGAPSLAKRASDRVQGWQASLEADCKCFTECADAVRKWGYRKTNEELSEKALYAMKN